MAQLGIMIEAQEDLTWARWRGLIDRTEALGFESIWRSDHLFSIMDGTSRDALALWPSLTVAATQSERLRFGPLVCPVTFRHPVIVARSAAVIDQLSGGRFELGLGAGWNRHEHDAFGFPFPSASQRFDMLEEAIQVIRLLWTGEPVSFTGRYYQLRDAQMRPTPGRQDRLPIIIGGIGEKRSLKIVAQYADEWNVTGITPQQYEAKQEILERFCVGAGRDPMSIRRSWMGPYLIGRNQEELTRRAARLQQIDSRLRAVPTSHVPNRLQERGGLAGTPEEVATEIRAWEAAGVERFMLQTLDQQDLDALELLAHEVIPQVS
jgi:F420-dependent oxidoreductase-like protein